MAPKIPPPTFPVLPAPPNTGTAWPPMRRPMSASATSTVPDQGGCSYSANNLIRTHKDMSNGVRGEEDLAGKRKIKDDKHWAWCAPGLGTGTVLTLKFEKTLSGWKRITFHNGYTLNASTYGGNHMPHQISAEYYLSGQLMKRAAYALRKEESANPPLYAGDIGNDSLFQIYEVPDQGNFMFDEIRITLTGDPIRASKQRSSKPDTCISEVYLLAY